VQNQGSAIAEGRLEIVSARHEIALYRACGLSKTSSWISVALISFEEIPHFDRRLNIVAASAEKGAICLAEAIEPGATRA
jgi:hypothetical protein